MKRGDLRTGVVYAYSRRSYDTPMPCVVLSLTPDEWDSGPRAGGVRFSPRLTGFGPKPGTLPAIAPETLRHAPTFTDPDTAWGPALITPRQLLGPWEQVMAERAEQSRLDREAREREAERVRGVVMRAGEIESALAEALSVLGPSIIVSADARAGTVVTIRIAGDDAIDRVRDALLRASLADCPS